MTEPPKLGKDALLDAAAVLFDDEGIDAVSLSRINATSGHKNRSAVTYHFGGKEAVVRALLQRSAQLPDAVRGALLDKLVREDPAPPPRAVLEVLIAPLSQQLGTPEGRRHLRLLGQVVGHPQYLAATQRLFDFTPNLIRCAELISPSLEHFPLWLQRERAAIVSGLITRAYADQARLVGMDEPPREVLSLDDFTTNLLDLLEAMLLTPTSIST
jgi:AcrR family transcriptional regulator